MAFKLIYLPIQLILFTEQTPLPPDLYKKFRELFTVLRKLELF